MNFTKYSKTISSIMITTILFVTTQVMAHGEHSKISGYQATNTDLKVTLVFNVTKNGQVVSVVSVKNN